MLTRISPSRGPGSPRVVGAHEPRTGSIQYVVIDEASRQAALVDTVLDFDPKAARVSTASAEWALALIEREHLTLAWILDTHPHADHLTASAWLKERTSAPTAIGEKVRDVARLWEALYRQRFDPGRDFDRLLADGECLPLGELSIRVMLSPGHTLASVTYLVGDAAFVHDTVMHPDSGTARCDFPGGSARALHRSLQAILALPDETRLFVGHDYGTTDRKEPAWESTVSGQRAFNAHLGGLSEDEFVALREARDATLDLPTQMLHALQVNLRGGRLPAPEADGCRYLRIPLDRF